MAVLIILAFVVIAFFVITMTIYWFNLDTKIVKLLEKPMTKYYDNIKRDRRL